MYGKWEVVKYMRVLTRSGEEEDDDDERGGEEETDV